MKTPSNKSTPEPELFEHVKLSGKYTVMEFAKLAVACTGSSPEERIEDAVEILSAVEKASRMDKWENERLRRLRIGDREGASVERIEKDKQAARRRERCFEIGKQCCLEAKRDDKTGQILRTSLINLACQKAGVSSGESKHASRLYSAFLKSTGPKLARRFAGATPENTPDWEKLSDECVDWFKNRVECGPKTLLMRSETEAHLVASSFISWLESRPKTKRKKPLFSKQTHQIVSPKTHGASRPNSEVTGKSESGRPRKNGQYAPKS